MTAAQKPPRGRPAGVMTQRRRQLLEAHRRLAAEGGRVSICRLARECGLYDYRDARRIIADLRRMGAL